MSINDLPDEILVKIFNYIKICYSDDWIEISKVNQRWESLIIQHRLKKIKYLICSGNLNHLKPECLGFLRHSNILKGLDLNHLMPQLKIVDFACTRQIYAPTMIPNDIITIINNTPTIKGIVMPKSQYVPSSQSEIRKLENIEMILGFLDDHFIINHYAPDKVTQLKFVGVKNFNIQINRLAEYFTNLVRLHIVVKESKKFDFYEGPIFPNLKILEFSCEADHSDPLMNADIYTGFRFLDFCPALESAHFETKSTNYLDCIDESIKNYNLKDLVIHYDPRKCRQKWPAIKSLLSKFPNLENLAIRGNVMIEDRHVPKLVKLLPKLKLIDFRESYPEIFQVTRQSADYLADYCQRSGRSIVIYYPRMRKELSDWPKIDYPVECICSGLDFMKHCFFKSFDFLPSFLDT